MPHRSDSDDRPVSTRPGGKTLRALRNAVALLIVYGNVVVALQPHALRRMGLVLPRPVFIQDAFLIPGMFSSYSLTNSDLILQGERTQTGRQGDRGRYIDLDLREHFVARHGVVFTQLFAAHHWDVYGPAEQRKAWAFLAQRIRERHNRLHPDAKIAKVRFGSVEWPQDPGGYRAAKQPGALQPREWFSEAPP
jgi:hypothetical protein